MNRTRAPLITVVVPTRDRHETLGRCMASLGNLDYPRDRLEVVVVDDRSEVAVDPGALELAGGLRVRVVRGEGRGPARARNLGLEAARGDVVAFTDDDCRPRPDWLRRLVEELGNRPSSLVGGGTVNALVESACAEASQVILELVYGFYNRDPGDARFLASNNLAARRERLLDAGGFDEGFERAGGEDRELCSRWRARGDRLVFAPAALVEHEHAMGLGGYVRQHFNYGCGAWRLHRGRGAGPMRRDLRFHLSAATWRGAVEAVRERGGLRLAFLLGVWQLANAVGFAWAFAVDTLGGRASDGTLLKPGPTQ